ncbi:MAG: hypothetical protein KKF74_05350 [Nanoarchaeota archaeon]|nr:hypothetical protein [Nanoarchaeota archaeon]
MKKRGQITVFVIIGILVILGFLLFFYLREKTTFFSPEIVVPQEIAPVKRYVESCMQDIGEKAVIKLGMQSGYVEIPEDIAMNPGAYIQVGGPIKLPYWYLNGMDTSPKLSDMQSQISDYVSKNLKSCLRNFSDFDEFVIEEKGEIKTKTVIAEEEVVITVDYPLVIKNKMGDKITTLSQYAASVPVRLKKIYRLAKGIMESENKGMFLEKTTIDLMALDPEIPFTDMVFSCKNLEWSKADVEQSVKELLYYNLPKIRIDKTDYIPFLYDPVIYRKFQEIDIEKDSIPKDIPEDIYEYNHFFWAPVSENFDDMKAGVRYMQDWGIQLEARPSDGDAMKPNMVEGSQKYLSMFCINIYHFTYDIIYPVEIAIRDEKSFNNNGYVFRFAFPVLINHNQGDRSDFGMTKLASYQDAGFCNELTEEDYVISAKNSRTNKDLDNVSISFNCIKYQCNLGFIKAEANRYRLKTKLPSACVNGIIIAEKDGYLRAEQQVIESDVLVMMDPLKSFDFKVMKFKVDKNNENIGSSNLGNNEKAVIYIKSLNKSHDVFATYPAEEGMEEIELVDNDNEYYLEIFLMNGDQLTGGFKADWKLSYNNLIGKDKITFYVYDEGVAKTDDDKVNMIKFLNDNRNKNELMPKFE